MKTAVYYNYGPPKVLSVIDTEKPIPKKNEVLVKVFSTTVNRTDCAMLEAKPFIMRFFTGLFKPKNSILGTELTGVIEEIGADVSAFKKGDKVFGFYDGGLKTYAEYTVISDDKPLVVLPEDFPLDKAYGSIEGMHYAYNFTNKVHLKKGDWVLVNGATGAIGSATKIFRS